MVRKEMFDCPQCRDKIVVTSVKGSGMQVLLKAWEGRSIPMTCCVEMSVLDLKYLVCSRLGLVYRTGQIRLRCCGKTLLDDKLLCYYNISQLCTIEVNCNIRGD